MENCSFDETNLNEIFSCLNCRKGSQNHRILPCGETICTNCIDLLLEKEKNAIRCPYCRECHSIPESGSFPENKIMTRHIEKYKDIFTKEKLTEHLIGQLSEISDKAKELTEARAIGKQKLKENCDNVRKSVLDVSHEAHNFLENQKNKFISLVREYMVESERNYSSVVQYKNEFDAVINEITAFHDKWSEYLKKFTFDEVMLSEASQQATKYLIRLEKDLNKLRERLFHGKVIKFKPNIKQLETEVIGKLVFSKGDENVNNNSEKGDKI